MRVRIRIIDEVTAIIIGLTDTHFEYFYNRYAVFAPNYFFHPKYQLGQWDGKIRFFSRVGGHNEAGKTFVYLLEDLVSKLDKLGYKIQVEDERVGTLIVPELIDEHFLSDILHLDTGEPIIMRPHQVAAVNSLLPHGNGIIEAATSSGKTIMCAALVRAYGKHNIRSLTIVPNQDLIRQTKVEYINAKIDTGEYSGTHKTLNHQHVVSTWQALKNNPVVVNQFQMVIVDECLDKNTFIKMADGTQKNICDIQPGDSVLSYDESCGNFIENKVVEVHENLTVSSQEKMYRLEMDNDSFIDVTGNHKILTTVGYVRADELTFDHEIIDNIDRKT